MRVVRDEDVDRVQVYGRRRQSRALLIARNFLHHAPSLSRTSKSVVRRCFTFLACGDTSDISRRVDSRQANREAESRDRVACRDDSKGQDK